jgi:hypothetical protein
VAIALSGIAHIHAAKPLFQFEKRGLGNRMLATKISDRHSAFLLSQYPNNLLFVKSALLYRLLLKNAIRLYSFLDQFAGPRSVVNT